MCQSYLQGELWSLLTGTKKDTAFTCILSCKHIVYAAENGLCFVFVRADVAVKILRVTAEKKENLGSKRKVWGTCLWKWQFVGRPVRWPWQQAT